MPDPVECLIAASPAAVVASLTSALVREGWVLTGIGDFGRSVTWRAMDARLEMAELEARVVPVPGQPGVVALTIGRVDPAMASIERFVSPGPVDPRRRRSAG